MNQFYTLLGSWFHLFYVILLSLPNCSSLNRRHRLCQLLEVSFFCLSTKVLLSSARSFLSELRRALCPRESHSFFCSPLVPNQFCAAAADLSSSAATGLAKVGYPVLKYLFRSGMDLLLDFHFFPFVRTS